jgi:hypothetical protein
MPQFLIIDQLAGIQAEIDFSTFVEIVKGMSVTSAASSDDMKFIELGLSENFNLRVEVEHNDNTDVIVILKSTLNTDEIPPLRIQIVPDNDGQTTAEAIEKDYGCFDRPMQLAF